MSGSPVGRGFRIAVLSVIVLGILAAMWLVEHLLAPA